MGIPKSGEDSVGVARQWCGATGKVDNCQVTVNCTLARPGERQNADQLTWPLGMRLYLPKSGLEQMTQNTTINSTENSSLSAEKTRTFPTTLNIGQNSRLQLCSLNTSSQPISSTVVSLLIRTTVSLGVSDRNSEDLTSRTSWTSLRHRFLSFPRKLNCCVRKTPHRKHPAYPETVSPETPEKSPMESATTSGPDYVERRNSRADVR